MSFVYRLSYVVYQSLSVIHYYPSSVCHKSTNEETETQENLE